MFVGYRSFLIVKMDGEAAEVATAAGAPCMSNSQCTTSRLGEARLPAVPRQASDGSVGRMALRLACAAGLIGWVASGCGINKSRLATEQLVVSEAIDKAVASIDFTPLSGRKVYFDTQYIEGTNLGSNANIKYAISSLRQQMMAYDVRLQEKPETAEFIVEGRIGVLANDGYEVTYGIPGNAAAVSATVLLSTPVPVPQPGFPELSLGRRNHQAGTAKIGLFAYDRVTREPVWQAGVKTASSNVRDTWFLGLGPYQSRPKRPRSWWRWLENPAPVDDEEVAAAPMAAYKKAIVFRRAVEPASDAGPAQVAPVGGQQPIGTPAAASTNAPVGQGLAWPPSSPPGSQAWTGTLSPAAASGTVPALAPASLPAATGSMPASESSGPAPIPPPIPLQRR
jgi:hypothetical protein